MQGNACNLLAKTETALTVSVAFKQLHQIKGNLNKGLLLHPTCPSLVGE